MCRALIVRWFLLPLALTIAGTAVSQESSDHKAVAQKNQKANEKQTAPKLDTSSLEKAIRESIKEASQKPDANADEKLKIDRKLSEYTGQLSVYTEKLSNYTLWLVIATIVLAIIALWQGRQLKRTVDTSVIESQPALSPYVVDMEKLHELPKPGVQVTFNGIVIFYSSILFIFENYGKTPAIIRRVQADLFLTEKDSLPKVNFHDLPVHHHEEIIQGGTKRDELGKMAAVDLRKKVEVDNKQFQELLSEAKENFRRFFLVGVVIYDDVFGYRHTRRFCRKLRLAHGVRFQAQHGGMAYNSIRRQKIPKKDPLDKVET
jgi:hypothetical protein